MTPTPKPEDSIPSVAAVLCPFCGDQPCCSKSVETAKQRDRAAKENFTLNMKAHEKISTLKAQNERLAEALKLAVEFEQGKANYLPAGTEHPWLGVAVKALSEKP